MVSNEFEINLELSLSLFLELGLLKQNGTQVMWLSDPKRECKVHCKHTDTKAYTHTQAMKDHEGKASSFKSGKVFLSVLN